MKCVLPAILLCCLATTAKGEFTGMTLQEMCTSKNDGMVRLCRIWISGFASGLFVAQAEAKEQSVTCLPNGGNGAQAILVIKKIYERKPPDSA